MKYEYCCKCDCATGKAGAGDDSLYTETDGPFCKDCFPEFKSKQEQSEPNNSEYERGFIDGMQKQMQSSVDKAVRSMKNKLTQEWEVLQSIKRHTITTKEWVGLNVEELNAISDNMRTWNSFQITDFYFAIEAKLKEKNT